MQRANVAVLAACLGVLACGEPPTPNLPGYTPGSGDGTGGNGDGTGGNGTGGNGTGGNGTNGGGGGGGSDDICQEQKIGNNKVIPEVLIVLDRSGSMDMGNDRWTPSVNAIKKVTEELGGSIEFGLMAFPGAGPAPAPKDCSSLGFFERLACELENSSGGWGNADQCEVGSLAVPVGFDTATDINTALGAMRPNGGTPTALTLAEAGKYLADSQGAVLDGIPQPQYVLLVTDGEPNCGGDVGDTVKQIQDLAKAGVKTFVIGYEISGRTIGDMDRMAAAGDTGYTKHLAVQNEATLVAAMQEITGQLASCTVALEEPVDDPTYVLVSLNGRDITLNQPDGNGFSVDPEGRIVTILGDSCETLRNPKPGEVNQIAVSVQCTPQILY